VIQRLKFNCVLFYREKKKFLTFSSLPYHWRVWWCRNLKIYQYLAKLWATVGCPFYSRGIACVCVIRCVYVCIHAGNRLSKDQHWADRELYTYGWCGSGVRLCDHLLLDGCRAVLHHSSSTQLNARLPGSCHLRSHSNRLVYLQYTFVIDVVTQSEFA